MIMECQNLYRPTHPWPYKKKFTERAVSYLNEPENYQKECERIQSLAKRYLSERKDILDAWRQF